MSNGRIVSFFSTRDGLGRSMILSDLAWIFASNGRRVIAIDWNLEAPGLADFFHPFLPDDFQNRPGVIDVFWDELLDAMRFSLSPRVEAVQLQPHLQPIRWNFPNGGRLDFMSAGRGSSLRTRTALFPWEVFARRYGGTTWIDTLRLWLRAAYDYVLIDARTGALDSLGICTVSLPDILVCPFSMIGSNPTDLYNVLSPILEQRADAPPRIFPVPTGVQRAEMDLLDRVREHTRGTFATIHGLDDEYWAEAEVLYQPFYAYLKIPSVFAERPRLRRSAVLSVMERLAGRVSGGEVTTLPPMSETNRSDALDAYRESPIPVVVRSELPKPFDGDDGFLFVSYKREEFPRTVPVLTQLTDLGYRVWWDAGIVGGDEWERRLQERIKASSAIVVFLSVQASSSEQIRTEIETARRLGKPIVPLRLDTSLPITQLEELVGKLQFIDDPRHYPSQALEGAIRLAIANARVTPYGPTFASDVGPELPSV